MSLSHHGLSLPRVAMRITPQNPDGQRLGAGITLVTHTQAWAQQSAAPTVAGMRFFASHMGTTF